MSLPFVKRGGKKQNKTEQKKSLERVTVLQPVLFYGQGPVTVGLENTSRRGRVKLYLEDYARPRPDTKSPKYSQRKVHKHVIKKP